MRLMAANVVTIFGGSGFLGRYLVRPLAETGARIRVAVRHPNAALFLKPLGDVGQVQLIQANVRHEGSVMRAVEGADAVVNLVGVLSPSGKQTFDAIHGEGAGTIAKAAAAAGAGRFVQVSAIGAAPKSESRYARSKAAGEAAVRDAFPDATILRPSIVFGPEDDFFNRFAAMARLAPALPLVGGGQTRFQPVYVCDVADAIMAALNADRTQGRLYELGGPRIYTFEDLLRFVLEAAGRSRPLVSLPFGLASFIGFFAQMLPNPPLTPDQVKLLKTDNVVAEGALALSDLGIDAECIEAIVPAYLQRFRKGGQFSQPAVS